jgi:SAM-dependent methyltransferase
VALDPTDRAALLGLADALFQHPDPPRDLEPELLLLLDTDGIDHQRIERAVRRVLGDEAGSETRPLFLRWLERTIVAQPAAIARIAALRSRLLVRVAAGSEAPPALVRALATQAWNTEYACPASPDDDALLDALVAAVPSPARIAAFTMFRPVSAWPAASDHGRLAETRDEEARAASLQRLGSAGDAVSDLVRAQYEENPYPRLVEIHRRSPRPFAAYVAGALGRRVPTPEGPIRVLVAGGGTGQHPLTVATALVDAEVVCVDLSARSLGRAARVAERHGVSNVRFVVGDLLGLGPDDGLGPPFQFVDCVGVLHHLADPLRGGAALVTRLAPDGLMRLGVYSERGRSEIVAARRLVSERGWMPTFDGLRHARAELLALPPDHPAAPVTRSVDFYSQSGLRDLVFHPCEHRYTPAQVGTLVRDLGLEVVGLQHARPEGPAAYREAWPDDPAMADLDRWDTLEARHPRLFAGMIHVWCRRPAG